MDEELSTSVREDVARHLSDCAGCAGRLEELRGSSVSITRALATLDHDAPHVPVDAVRSISRARGRRRRSLAAAAVLLVVASSAAAALPGSPLRRIVQRWLGEPARAPASSTIKPDQAGSTKAERPRTASGIAFAAGESVTVDFAASPVTGELRIRFADGADVIATGSSARTRYALTGRGVTVTPGDSGSFDLEIPRRTDPVRVRIAGHVVFAKVNGRVTTEGTRDSSGTLHLRFSSHQRDLP
ncbi:MAG: hypothetical protein HY084_11645 [Gemmatimonadetes bacterium]|nr:hypothetical protein [Gemmatimonadota bacterium]